MTEQNIKHIILDRTGNIYYLVGEQDEESLRSCLVGEDGPAGKLDLIYESPDEWVIANLELFAEAPKKTRNWFLKRARDFGLWKPKLIDYRFRGLGTALLNFVEERAQLRQVKRITGYVVRRDYAAWSKLLE